LDHELAGLAELPDAGRVYLRPVGLVDGPYADPDCAQQLAGGAVWFSGVQIIGRLGLDRVVSTVVPVAALRDGQGVPKGVPQRFAARVRSQWQALTSPRPALTLGTQRLTLARPHVMGILNVTPDSFSDGGRFLDPAAALAQARTLAGEGAAILDIGAESTRPGAETIPEADEVARLEPILATWSDALPPLSLDTRKAAVMRFGLARGVALVNDVSALTFDPTSAAVLAAGTVPVVLMHAQGDPQTMQMDPRYADVLLDVFDWLEARLAAAETAGIARGRIIVDPGIGFGKTLRHNLDLMNGLALFHALGCPLLVGASRKRFIGALTRQEQAADRVAGSVAAALHAASQGAQLLRAHDVAPTVEALAVWQGLRDAGVSPPLPGG
jgi:dihydropteroate synthase